jgi:hypothetical protein
MCFRVFLCVAPHRPIKVAAKKDQLVLNKSAKKDQLVLNKSVKLVPKLKLHRFVLKNLMVSSELNKIFRELNISNILTIHGLFYLLFRTFFKTFFFLFFGKEIFFSFFS